MKSLETDWKHNLDPRVAFCYSDSSAGSLVLNHEPTNVFCGGWTIEHCSSTPICFGSLGGKPSFFPGTFNER